MKALPIMCCLLTGLIPGIVRADAPSDTERAHQAVADFAGALKAELTAAMQAGGPLNAVEVCKLRAPAIAQAVSLDTDMNVSRVSLRNRNPENAANAWQTAVLQDFETRHANGEPAETLNWQGVVAHAGGREYRFMKAIPTAPMCLACHGEVIAPPVAEKVALLYPDDKAVGYREGDLRGAFVVTVPLD